MEMVRTDERLASLLTEKFGLRVTLNDIKKCDPDMTQKIYIHFLKDIGASLEQINTLPFEVSESVQQYPDMYRKALRTMNLAKFVKYFLYNIFGDNSFMPADLYDPKPKKTKHFFWMLLEFISQPSEQLNEIEDEVSLKRETQGEMWKNISKLKEQLQQQKLEKAELKIKEDEEEKRIAEGSAKLEECQDRKNKLKSEVEQKKLTCASLCTAIKEAEMQVIQAKERVKDLSNQVVQDSERVEIQERESRLAQLRTDLQNKKDYFAQFQQDLAIMEQYRDTVTTMVATIRDIQQEYNKDKENFATMTQLSQEQGKVQEQLEDKAMQIQQLNHLIESEQAKISQMHHTWSMNKESILEEIKQHKLTLEELRRSKTEFEIAYQDLENEHSHITGENIKVKEEIINIDNFITTCYSKIIHAMEENNQSLQSTLTEVQQTLEQYRVE
ncbi:hypothetical protein Pmani_024856 [Petrolisthes manimaculis]|uniref:Kinetochore protein Nuf2 N-terminal domain-containing protein n=1 Tax=Petrolisthes manimaculis TaxID=1843537 RepID=A0AAE1P7V7_9EUCA|nr:hypothetical protein Pmani_024856 [Petrolisthes manimaculis]